MSTLLLTILLFAEPRALTLEETVKLALASEPSIAGAQINRERAQLAVLRADLDRFSVKVDAQIQELWAKTNIGGRGEGFEGALGLTNLSAALNVPVFSGFAVEANVARAERMREAADIDIKVLRRNTALAAARAYWSVRKIGLLEEAQMRALERLRGAEEIAGARVRAGLAPPIDQNRTTSRRLLQEATLADLHGRSREASAELAVALGIREEIVLTDALTFPATEQVGSEESFIDAARTARPEILLANKRLEAQHQTLRIAESTYYPQLSAFALFQFGNNPAVAGAGSSAVFGTSNPFNAMAGDFQIGAVLNLNIFDTLHTWTAVKDATYEELRLATEIRSAERTVETEVRTARAKVEHYREMRAKLLPAEDVARDNVSIIQKRYENGEALIFELLDAEIELLDIERQRTEAGADLQLAHLELEASLGTVVGEKQ
jgi:outer membrane protein TolC